MGDEGSIGCKTRNTGKIVTKPVGVVPANSVPAAAVIQGGQALFVMTGRKGHVGGLLSFFFQKSPGLTGDLEL